MSMKLKTILTIFSHSPDKALAIFVSIVSLTLLLLQLFSIFQPLKQNISNQKINNKPNEKSIITADSLLFSTPLFGDYLPNPSDTTIRQSSLDIELAGIMYSVNAHDSQVLIRIDGGNDTTYVIGDELPGGAVIKQINKKGIVIFYHGALESVSLPKHTLLFDKPAQPLFKE